MSQKERPAPDLSQFIAEPEKLELSTETEKNITVSASSPVSDSTANDIKQEEPINSPPPQAQPPPDHLD